MAAKIARNTAEGITLCDYDVLAWRQVTGQTDEFCPVATSDLPSEPSRRTSAERMAAGQLAQLRYGRAVLTESQLALDPAVGRERARCRVRSVQAVRTAAGRATSERRGAGSLLATTRDTPRVSGSSAPAAAATAKPTTADAAPTRVGEVQRVGQSSSCTAVSQDENGS